MSSGNSRLRKPIWRSQAAAAPRIETTELNIKERIQHVAFLPEPEAKPWKCWDNVAKKVWKDGGKVVMGWDTKEYTHTYYLRSHAIWEAPDGKQWDITPPYNEERKFIEDKGASRQAGKACAGIVRKDDTLEGIAEARALMKLINDELAERGNSATVYGMGATS